MMSDMEQKNSRLVVLNILLSLFMFGEVLAITYFVSGPFDRLTGMPLFMLFFLLVLLPLSLGGKFEANPRPAISFAGIHILLVAMYAGFFYLHENTSGAGWPVPKKLFYSLPLILAAHWSLVRVFFKRAVSLAGYLAAASLAVIFVKYFKVIFRIKAAWKALSWTVGVSTAFLLRVTGFKTHFECAAGSTPVIGTDRFTALVATPCSGMEGIYAFIVLYAITLVLNRKQVNAKRAWIAGFGGIGIMYAVNVVRIYVLILIGHFTNKQLAVDLWHSQGSLIYYVIVLVILISLLQKWVLKK